MNSLTRLRILGATTLLLLLAGVPTNADTALRFQGQTVSSDGNALGFGDGFDSAPGIYLGVERKISDRLGVEVGAAWTEFDQSIEQDLLFASVDISTSVQVVPVTVALDIHLTPGARSDFYIAPRIGYAFFDDMEIDTDVSINFGGIAFPGFPSLNITDSDIGSIVTTSIGVEDQFIYGLRIGYDVPLGDRGAWIFSSSVDYTAIDFELEPAAGATTGLDPLAVGVGLAFRF